VFEALAVVLLVVFDVVLDDVELDYVETCYLIYNNVGTFESLLPTAAKT